MGVGSEHVKVTAGLPPGGQGGRFGGGQEAQEVSERPQSKPRLLAASPCVFAGDGVPPQPLSRGLGCGLSWPGKSSWSVRTVGHSQGTGPFLHCQEILEVGLICSEQNKRKSGVKNP